MSKTKKYSLAYWAKKCMNAWMPEKDILLAVQTLIQIGSHPEIDFSGTPLELATALYLERFKRGTPWSGFFPTPAVTAAWAADLLPLNRGAIVLDPGCGFGSLSYAVQQRGAHPIMVECSSAVVPIAQAIWGEAQVQQRDFLDGFRPTEFDAVITNPPFGNVFGHSDAAGDFLERIAELSRSGTYVSAILPRGYLSVERPKRRVEIAQRFTIIEKHDLAEETFAPLTKIATTLYLLNVRRDGALVGEVLPRQAVIDQCPESEKPVEVTLPKSADPEPDLAQYQVVQEQPADFVLIRGLHPTAGWAVVKAFPPEHRSEAIEWLRQRGIELNLVEGVTPAECGATSNVTTADPLAGAEAEAVRTFAGEVDGELVRVDYDPQRQIGPDVCFDFHGPTISASGYHTRFVKRDPTLSLELQARAEAALAVAAWQKHRVSNQKTWPVKYAGDVAVQVGEQVVRGTPISWNDHEQDWRIWLCREACAVTVKPDDVLENWSTYFVTHLQPGDHIVYCELNQRVEADVVRVIPGSGFSVEVTRRHDGWKCFVSPADLVGLWDELSPAERGETFSMPNFGIANTDPLEMTDNAFTAWAEAIDKTSPQVATGWRQVRAAQQAQGLAAWPRLSADDNRPRAELPGQLHQWYTAHPTQLLQHSTSTAYEAWGNDHLTIMQPQGERGLPWTVCYATRIPSAQDAGEYVPLPLTLITQGDDRGNVQGATLFEALAVLREHLQGWGVETRLTLQPRDSAWNATVLRELLEIIGRGAPVLIAEDDLGLPTIHHLPNPEHLGYGTFRSVTDEYTVNWDAGGSMNRLSNGRGWTTVRVERGIFPYDFAQVKQTIEHWIAEFEAQAPRFSITTLHVDTTHIKRDFANAAQAAQGKEPWQMRYNEFMATQRPISNGAQDRMLLDLILAHARDIQTGNDNEAVSAKISADAIVWLSSLRETLVQIALAELKPVPTEVLADYPDLAAKYPAPSATDASEPATAEPLPPTAESVAPAVAKPTKSKRETKQPAPESRVDYPAIWHKRDKFEFHLDGALVVAEYDGSDSIGFDHGGLHYAFHGSTISTTGFRSHFAKFSDAQCYGDPVNAAIAIAKELVAVTAKEVAKNKKTWPVKYAGDVAVRLDDGRTVRGMPISWNDFNQWWYVWLIEAPTARTIKPDEIVGAWPTTEVSAVPVCPCPPSPSASPADSGTRRGSERLVATETPAGSEGMKSSAVKSVTAQPIKPIKRPAGLPDDIPEVIEVDVGGRVPQWIAATIVKVVGGKQLTCRRSDGHGDLKTPIYGRDITWRVPQVVGA